MTSNETGVGQIQTHAPSRDDQLRPWLHRAGGLIRNRLADTRAHAEAGRALEANERLAELRRDLIDDQSGAGSLLSNARAAFYRQAFHAEPFDDRIHRELRPDPAGELAARFSLIAGRNQYLDARLLIEEITGSMRGLAAVQAADIGYGPDNWPARWDGWQKRHTEALTSHVHGTLSDAQMALTEAVGRVRIKTELQ
jgi:hypothetical protein